MPQYTVFTSDVHLKNTFSKHVKLFIRFVDQTAANADALYILGDLFHTFIGDDDLNPVNRAIIEQLKKCAQSIPVYYVLGNHDSMVTDHFCEKSHVTKLPLISAVNIYGTSVLLTHGDIFCTRSILFQFMRQLYNNVFCKKVFLRLPLFIRQRIAGFLISDHHLSRHRPLPYKMNVSLSSIEQAMRKYDTPLLIHGHTHRPHIQNMNFQIGNQDAKKISLGCWTNEQGCYLRYSPSGQHELLYFKN
jgi:UDP-2,3-diacylglucosamine hydrolase